MSASSPWRTHMFHEVVCLYPAVKHIFSNTYVCMQDNFIINTSVNNQCVVSDEDEPEPLKPNKDMFCVCLVEGPVFLQL